MIDERSVFDREIGSIPMDRVYGDKMDNIQIGDRVKSKHGVFGETGIVTGFCGADSCRVVVKQDDYNGYLSYYIEDLEKISEAEQPMATKQNGETEPKKESAGKPAFDILFELPLRSVAQTLTSGNEKYGRLNWRKAENLSPEERHVYWKKLVGAALRHIDEQMKTDDNLARVDPGTKTEHLACAIADLLMALDLLE